MIEFTLDKISLSVDDWIKEIGLIEKRTWAHQIALMERFCGRGGRYGLKESEQVSPEIVRSLQAYLDRGRSNSNSENVGIQGCRDFIANMGKPNFVTDSIVYRKSTPQIQIR